MPPVISVENLSKSYHLGQIGTGTFTNDLKLWWAKVRGKPNPLLRIGETDHGNRDGKKLWALRDVSFTVQQGEVLGIIGRNGAGKSTLLKILSRVTAPTSGKIKVKGRVASLLEVGTGFHPDLTGRENIYLNGAILGMSRKEISSKFDKIVDFAEVEKFIDTPVKRYSSGMYVRLAFAIAAHLEPEILVVDEVLAVGDADFQMKCLGKMGDVAKEGRTVLFVSHNMSAIRQLCDVVALLRTGQMVVNGESDKVVADYLANAHSLVANRASVDILKPHIVDIQLRDHNGLPITSVQAGERATLAMQIETKNSKRLVFGLTIFNSEDIGLLSAISSDTAEYLPTETKTMTLEIPTALLHAGKYRIEGALMDHKAIVDQSDCFLQFEVYRLGAFDLAQSKAKGILRFPMEWSFGEGKNGN